MAVHHLRLARKPALQETLDAQRAAFRDDPFPARDVRLNRLQRLDDLLQAHKEPIIEALNADFGCRARSETLLAEIVGCRGSIHYARKNLRQWMRQRRRKTSFWFLPAKTFAVAQPLGVVGIMSPWNYALHLSIAPMVAALAAGNRVMLCMSEETPRLCALLQRAFGEVFEPELVSVVQGGGPTSETFASLPFDHLLFTGSTRVGKLIAQAAAKNLTPVTLELGGKSPAIVAPDYSVLEAADRIGWGKMFNAGQTCVAPDYVFVPRASMDAFAGALLDKFTRAFAGMDDPDLTAIVSERFFRRHEALVAQARDAGAAVLMPDGYTPQEHAGVYKFPLTLVLDPPSDIALMQEEIFGPILPLLPYDDLAEVTEYINARDRPLSLYLFSHDRARIAQTQRETISGTYGVNEPLVQFAQEDLAFGGVGASGQGAYHGQAGFDTFSHLKSVFVQRGLAGLTGIKLLHPPYGRVSRLLIRLMGG